MDHLNETLADDWFHYAVQDVPAVDVWWMSVSCLGESAMAGNAWPEIMCALVAHHSGSRFVARVLGVDDRLREFDFVEDLLSDALTVADNTVGPNGTIMAVDERLREKQKRHGPDSPNARANPERDDYIRTADRRVAHRLAILDQPRPNLGDVNEQSGHRRAEWPAAP